MDREQIDRGDNVTQNKLLTTSINTITAQV